jgi:Omp85 superfamily domain
MSDQRQQRREENAMRQQQQQQQQQHATRDVQKQPAVVGMEQQQQQQQRAVQTFAGNYEIQLEWPAKVMSINNGSSSSTVRTSNELIQHRLMESGILYDVPITTGDVVTAASQFIANLERSDCFHTMHVEIGRPSSPPPISATVEEEQSSSRNDGGPPLRCIHIRLEEKKWYKLHAGAGLKTDGWLGGSSSTTTSSSSPTTDAFLPMAEMELRAGCRNIAGCLDRTDLQYTVDTHNIGTWSITHARPLYTVLPTILSDALLVRPTGSQYGFAARAALDTSDHIAVSSFHEYQRLLTVKATTAEHAVNSPAVDNPKRRWYSSIEWGVLYRDLIPRRHASMPYHFAASREIVAQSGASVKHGVTLVTSYNNIITDSSNLPVEGLQLQCSAEVATPPGDIGFIKGQAAIAGHHSLNRRLALHTSVAAGYLHALSFGGLCGPPLVSDRFLLGSTGSFRGFIPAGIGPRSGMVGATNGGLGDALGGNFFYSATAMISSAPPETIEAFSQITRNVRLFGFATAGTCVSVDNNGGKLSSWNVTDICGSSRLSAGIGIATGALGPRIEATYAWPLRYGPVDGRRRFQFGVSVSIV